MDVKDQMKVLYNNYFTNTMCENERTFDVKSELLAHMVYYLSLSIYIISCYNNPLRPDMNYLVRNRIRDFIDVFPSLMVLLVGV